MRRIREINMENGVDNFSDDIVNIKCHGPNNIEIDERSNKSIFIYNIGYVTPNSVIYHQQH